MFAQSMLISVGPGTWRWLLKKFYIVPSWPRPTLSNIRTDLFNFPIIFWISSFPWCMCTMMTKVKLVLVTYLPNKCLYCDGRRQLGMLFSSRLGKNCAFVHQSKGSKLVLLNSCFHGVGESCRWLIFGPMMVCVFAFSFGMVFLVCWSSWSEFSRTCSSWAYLDYFAI